MLKTLRQDIKRISTTDRKWLAVWAAIYAGFLILDIIAPNFWGSSLLKYIGIFLCIIYAWHKNHSDTKLILALLFTFLADTILVWTNWEIAGVFVFCIAQGLHFMRLTKLDQKYLVIITACAASVLTYGALNHDNILYDITFAYAILLICNVIMSYRRYHEHKNDPHSRYTWYGFLAFILCDTCVGTRHLMLDGILPSGLLPLIAYLVWVFYYPSQVLLANSSFAKDTKVAKNHSIS